MSVLSRLRFWGNGDNGHALMEAEERLEGLGTELTISGDNLDLLWERMAELELSLEDQGWHVLSGISEQEFSRRGLSIINRLARFYFLKNPLIKRAVLTQTQYVMGQGVNIQAVHPLVDEVIQDFMEDEKNEAELTDHQAMMIKETELQCFANLFFVFFINRYTGHVRIRTIPVAEITEIIANPDDAKDPWYYKRVWASTGLNVKTGQYESAMHTALYPDWRYKPSGNARNIPESIGGIPVMRENPVYHVSVNRLSDMRFGVSEIYAAIDWARAYKEFLENWSSIVKAHARFAWELKTKGGAAGVATAKAKLASTLGTGTETNPAPTTASTLVTTEGVKLNVPRTGGATTKAVDGRQLRLMVCSATGIFEHYLTGDPSTGNLATAKAMELPMLIMFRDRQQLWTSILAGIFDFVIMQAVKAGKLPGTIVRNDYGEEVVVLADDVDNEAEELQDKPINDHVEIDFPNILEKDIKARVDAIVAAATLGGKSTAGTMTPKLLARLLLEALGLDDIDEMLNELFPPGEEEELGEQPGEEEPPPEEEVGAVFASALRKAMTKLQEAARGN